MKQLLQGVVVAIARLLHLLVKKQEAMYVVGTQRAAAIENPAMAPLLPLLAAAGLIFAWDLRKYVWNGFE
jgi:hypothetical protein